MQITAPFAHGSSTSHAAAVAITPRKQSIAAQVFASIETSVEGMTCAEVETALGLKHQTASPRFNELAHAQCIRGTGAVRDGSEVYAAVPGATMDRYTHWQRVKKVKSKPVVSDTPPELALTASETEILRRARQYSQAYWTNRPAQETDAARNALLDMARNLSAP